MLTETDLLELQPPDLVPPPRISWSTGTSPTWSRRSHSHSPQCSHTTRLSSSSTHSVRIRGEQDIRTWRESGYVVLPAQPRARGERWRGGGEWWPGVAWYCRSRQHAGTKKTEIWFSRSGLWLLILSVVSNSILDLSLEQAFERTICHLNCFITEDLNIC